jgi:dTDP-4-dehydrorhamnose 3,5-epimerase
VIFEETALPGAYIVQLEKREDERGFFARSWDRAEFAAHGLADITVQTNISFNSARGTLRGMHWQAAPFQETKLVRCTRGALYDVIVDLRADSPTHRRWIGVELTVENHTALYVPADFAHGFITLADATEATYLMSREYAPGYDRGARHDDPAFAIAWPSPVRVISEKDRGWPDYRGKR